MRQAGDMTTAHRPTFHAAIGGKEQGGGRYISGVSRQHVHDLPSQMSLKSRALGQGTADEVGSKDLRAALEAREAEHLQAIGKAPAPKMALREPPPLPPPGATSPARANSRPQQTMVASRGCAQRRR